MKKLDQLIISIVFLLIISNPFAGNAAITTATEQPESLQIRCTSDLYGLVSSWVAGYEKLNPGLAISVEALEEDSIYQSSGEYLYILSSWNYREKTQSSGLEILAGHDITVPVISNRNPYLDKLIVTGIKMDGLVSLLSFSEEAVWSSVVQDAADIPLNIYIANSGPVLASIAQLTDKLDIPGSTISMVPEISLLKAVKDDPYAIGFACLESLLAADKEKLSEGIRVLPIDKNSNGKLDYMEDIYTDLDKMLRGIWIGKYPREMVNNIYILAETEAEDAREADFISWVLNDGQSALEATGHSSLINTERLGQLAKLLPAPPLNTPAAATPSLSKLITLILSVLVVIILFYYILSGRLKKARPRMVNLSSDISKVFSENSVAAPGGLHYDRTHTWAFMEKEGSVRVGIDDFLQNITGKISQLNMKTGGEKIRRGEPFLTLVQKGKKLTIYAPVTGTVMKANTRLYNDSSLINISPYDEGWIYLIEPDLWEEEIIKLKPVVKYKEWLKHEFARFKDFLTAALSDKKIDMSLIVLQDGGVIRSSILTELGPETWEDFQIYFLDLSK